MLLLTSLRTQIKWILAVFIVIFTLSVGFMYGTGGSGSDSAQRAGDFVVAKVGGEELHVSQLQEHLRSYVERRGVRNLSDAQMPLLLKAAFDEMVANRAVIDEVTRLKISAPAEDVESQMKAIEAQYVTKEAFMQAVRNQGQTMEQVRASVARELAIRKMLDDVAGGVVVGDDEVQTLYDALKGNFTLPAGIDANFAQFKTKESAEKFIADVAANGDWDKALEAGSDSVVQSSPADSPERIANTEMAGKLEPIAALKDGEMTAPIELTEEDYFVVRRVKAVEQGVRPLSEVEESLKGMILQSKKAEVQQNYIKELTDKMQIEILTPDLFKPTEQPASEEAAEAPAPEDSGTASEPAAPASEPAAADAPAENAEPAAEASVSEQPAAEKAEPAQPATEEAAKSEATAAETPAEPVKSDTAGEPAAQNPASAEAEPVSEAPAAVSLEVPATAEALAEKVDAAVESSEIVSEIKEAAETLKQPAGADAPETSAEEETK